MVFIAASMETDSLCLYKRGEARRDESISMDTDCVEVMLKNHDAVLIKSQKLALSFKHPNAHD